jgi:hypothetical protein
MIDYLYVGGPLDGHTVRAREGAPLCRDGNGRPLPVSVADRAVAKMNRGQEPGPLYVRFSGRHIWLPERSAQLRAEREAREASQPERTKPDIAQATRETYRRRYAEQGRRAARRGTGRDKA